jgi:mannuronan 5-epimerase
MRFSFVVKHLRLSFILSLAVILFSLESGRADNCIYFKSETREISVDCNAHFKEIDEVINDKSVLRDLGNGEWLLSANVVVKVGARLTIDSTDGKWLKIKGTVFRGKPYGLIVKGKLKVQNFKITSWDTEENSYIEQDSEGSKPRPYIKVHYGPETVISNSEIAYMGYSSDATQGIVFLHAENGQILDSKFHHMWFAFYSEYTSYFTISGNDYYSNHKYSIDPHTYTHHLLIQNNHDHHNVKIGEICSHECYNIVFEKNLIHDNRSNGTDVGILFSRNTYNSVARNNVIYNQDIGISLSESPNNKVYNNTISKCNIAIYLKPSSTKDNLIYKNTIREVNFGFMARFSTGNTLRTNYLKNIGMIDFMLTSDADFRIDSQRFEKSKIRGSTGSNKVIITNSGKIRVNGVIHDTDSSPFTATLSKKTLVVDSV